MRRDQIFPSKYLKEPDLRGREVSVVIDYVEQTRLNQKPALLVHFEGKEKALVCNATIFDQIVWVTGEDDTEQWRGQRITLFPTTTEFQGKSMPVIRVKPKANASSNGNARAAQQQRPPDPDPPFDDEDVTDF